MTKNLYCVVGESGSGKDTIVNYMCNFTPDYITYCKTNKIYKTINQDLEKQNIKRLYFDWNTAPIIAAYSNDRICAGS